MDISQDEIEKLINKYAWKLHTVEAWPKYDKILKLTKNEWSDLCARLELEYPEVREHDTPAFKVGDTDWSKSGRTYKPDLIDFIKGLPVFPTMQFYSADLFKERFPNIYHALCVEFAKIPTLLNDSAYEPIVLKWRLQHGI